MEDQISFPDPEVDEHLGEQLPAKPARILRTADASGDGPIRLINDAANLVASGEVSIAVAVGGEAMRTANKRHQAAAAQSPDGAKADLMAEASAAVALPYAKS